MAVRGGEREPMERGETATRRTGANVCTCVPSCLTDSLDQSIRSRASVCLLQMCSKIYGNPQPAHKHGLQTFVTKSRPLQTPTLSRGRGQPHPTPSQTYQKARSQPKGEGHVQERERMMQPCIVSNDPARRGCSVSENDSSTPRCAGPDAWRYYNRDFCPKPMCNKKNKETPIKPANPRSMS